MNRETKLGLYIVGGIVIALGFLAYGAVTFITQGVPTLARMERDRRFGDNGTANANLYIEGPFVEDYAASAIMELPEAPDDERDTPSVQLGFSPASGIVQAGLIRRPASNFRLQAFFEYSWAGGQERTRYLNFLQDGSHVVELRVNRETVAFFLDGARRFTLRGDKMLTPRSNPWLFLGTSATFVGNSAFGTISDIRVRRDGDRSLRPYRPTCNVSNGGIHILPYGNGWILGGTSMRSVPIAYAGCRGAFERHRELSRRQWYGL